MAEAFGPSDEIFGRLIMAKITHLAPVTGFSGFSFCEPYILDWVSPLTQDGDDHLFTPFLWEVDCKKCRKEASHCDLPIKNVPDNGLVHLPSRVGLPWCGANISSDASLSDRNSWLSNALANSVQGGVDLSEKVDGRVLIRGKMRSEDVHRQDVISCPDCRAKLESHGGGVFMTDAQLRQARNGDT